MKKLFAAMMAVMMVFSFASCFAITCDDALDAMAAAKASALRTYELAELEQLHVVGETYVGDVVISGNNAQISFENCIFYGDIINTADVDTRVIIWGSSVYGKCIFRNNTKEATMEVSFPKFVVDTSVEVVLEDCAGDVITSGDNKVVYNGESYTVADSELFIDYANPDAGYVPYEGQEADYFSVAQWWENGEKVILIVSEKEV